MNYRDHFYSKNIQIYSFIYLFWQYTAKQNIRRLCSVYLTLHLTPSLNRK